MFCVRCPTSAQAQRRAAGDREVRPLNLRFVLIVVGRSLLAALRLRILSGMNPTVYLVRYGAVPEVARFQCLLADPPERGSVVVVDTHRGLLLGSVLEHVRHASPADIDVSIVRGATEIDRQTAAALRDRCEGEFVRWLERIDEWELSLELIDLEWTLDGSKLILYVLTERGPDTTNLALQAAAAGLGIIEVQPVAAEGLVALPSSGGGCGTGGCGCHE